MLQAGTIPIPTNISFRTRAPEEILVKIKFGVFQVIPMERKAGKSVAQSHTDKIICQIDKILSK